MGQLTTRAAMPLIDGGVTALYQETDLELARDAIPSNITLIEGMLINDPGNPKLHIYAAQAYYAYAFAFLEETEKERAVKLYDRCFNHAWQVLIEQGMTEEKLKGSLDELEAAVNKLGKNSVPALFWSSSCWARGIDLNRDNADKLADLPRAVTFMRRVYELDEHYYLSGPNIFFGVYYGSRSPMLGGNFELSEAYFDKANAYNNNKLLVVNLYKAQYLERQRYDQQAFHSLLENIVNADDDLNPAQALVNQVAKQKASLLLKKEDQWF
jgi:hypothetical protein